MNFYDAWIFLNEHKMFRHLFENGLYTMVVKVNPETNEIDEDSSKNTKVQVWLEHGPWENQMMPFFLSTHMIGTLIAVVTCLKKLSLNLQISLRNIIMMMEVER